MRMFMATAVLVCSSLRVEAEDLVRLTTPTARVTIAVAGGGIIEFRRTDNDINPLNWAINKELEPSESGQPFLRGHFLCLDRWGAPSDAELERGMPFHGEAPRVNWTVSKAPRGIENAVAARMSCRLPLAGLAVRRTVELLKDQPVLRVTEEVTNTRGLGRVYNLVQHPSIAPPFLDKTTVVDTNATLGYLHGRGIPDSRVTASRWPRLTINARSIDLRHLLPADPDVSGSDVSSFMFADNTRLGWVTASNANAGLLLGYIWRTSDYPWLNIWRYRLEGRLMARGLEFGTTGHHQPFGILVRRGQILDRPLVAYIDAGECQSRTYLAFLLDIPKDYAGVGTVSLVDGRMTVVERGPAKRTRILKAGTPWADAK